MTAKEKVQSLINASSQKTGTTYQNLTSAVSALISGYGGGGGLPTGIAKIDCGNYIPSSNTTTAPTVNHNLGVIPDIIFYCVTDYDAARADNVNSLLAGIYIRGMKTKTSSTSSIDDYFACGTSNDLLGMSGLGVVTTPANRVQPTSTQLTLFKLSNSYYFKGGCTYRWFAIKFS